MAVESDGPGLSRAFDTSDLEGRPPTLLPVSLGTCSWELQYMFDTSLENVCRKKKEEKQRGKETGTKMSLIP